MTLHSFRTAHLWGFQIASYTINKERQFEKKNTNHTFTNNPPAIGGTIVVYGPLRQIMLGALTNNPLPHAEVVVVNNGGAEDI